MDKPFEQLDKEVKFMIQNYRVWIYQEFRIREPMTHIVFTLRKPYIRIKDPKIL
jgi:hypothetical protein